MSAENCDLEKVHMLSVEGASISEVDGSVSTVKVTLNSCLDESTLRPRGHIDLGEMSLQLQIKFLLGEVPPTFKAIPLPLHAKFARWGKHLRKKLSTYLEQQHHLLVANCPLIDVLQALVAAYAMPTNDDMWMYGLN
jgi:hypothetical protein